MFAPPQNSHRPRKRFGQNFLTDSAIINDIIKFIRPQQGQHLVEIGPGKGALTYPLLEHIDQLDAIEIDRDLARLLRQDQRIKLHEMDVLKFDFSSLMTTQSAASTGKESPGLRIIGNIPYNISTPLLLHLSHYDHGIKDIHLMLQKEVALRICAPPATRHYGRLSVIMQLYFSIDTLIDLGPDAFTPAPKVNSAFIRLQPHKTPPITIDNRERFEQLVRLIFSKRRKTLANNLTGKLTKTQIEELGIDPSRRPETLSLDEFGRLYNNVV